MRYFEEHFKSYYTKAEVNLVRKQLTISEVSKLLEISAHTIRYYEKEGLIMPTSRTDGGYRLYDMEALDRFEAVILLRECGIRVRDIKDLLNNYNEDKYTQILDESYDMVSDEIKKLTVIQKKLALVRSVRKEFVDGEFKRVQKPKIIIMPIERIDEIIFESPMELYDFYMRNGAEFLEDYEGIFYFTTIESHQFLCKMVNESDEQSIVFESGQYLSYTFTGEVSNQDISKANKIIKTYIDENSIETEGYPLIQLCSIRSMAVGDLKKDIIEILTKMK